MDKKWIRRSINFAKTPILFVPKNNGGLRFCVDYRKLNKITVKTRFLINETLDRFNGFKIFIKLDLKNAYHRIRMRKHGEWKIAFRTRYGHFECTVMFFGLTNVPAIFQIYINKFVVKLSDEFCVVYFDNIFIYSKTSVECIRLVKKILNRFKYFDLYVNHKKSVFSPAKWNFWDLWYLLLGYQLTEAKWKRS